MLLSSWYTKWKEKQIREAVEQARKLGYEEGYKAGKSEPREAASNPAQVGEDEAASTSTASSRFPEGEKLTEHLKSDSFPTIENV